jgi:hypothetical protein
VNTCISAVQHIRRLRGGSQSQLLRASDGAYYVCKCSNNPRHIRVLANEMLAMRLGLPMPEVEVIDICLAHRTLHRFPYRPRWFEDSMRAGKAFWFLIHRCSRQQSWWTISQMNY